MTKTVIFAAGLAVASSASADLTGATHSNLLDPSMYTITARDINGPAIGEIPADHYSNMDAGPNGFVAFPAAGGAIGADDYSSVAGNDIDLAEFGFVGGVDTSGGVAFFEFFDASSNFVDSFGVAFAGAGNFIYTITINSFPGGVTVPENGIVQMVVDDAGAFGPATLGQFFLGDAGPTIGSEDVNFLGGNDGQFSHNFRINGEPIPAPASMALLGLGGLAAARRRR
ncbi:MAG: PEP-CTERM sorting domain-containing protein [Phycisphaera sp.]|nr:MAG: PEP-CTERM sorting domain-containing protein [Phycisphaera sp.]